MKIGIGLFFCASLFFCSCENNKKLPILGERDTKSVVVNGKTVIDTIYHTIPDFSFTKMEFSFIYKFNIVLFSLTFFNFIILHTFRKDLDLNFSFNSKFILGS